MTEYSFDGIFLVLGHNGKQLKSIIKEMQDLGLNIEDQSDPAEYIGVNVKKLNVALMSSHNVTESIPLSKTSDLATPRPHLSQLKYHFNFTLSRIYLHST